MMLRYVLAVCLFLVGVHCVHVDVGGYYGHDVGHAVKPKKEHEKGQDFSKIPGKAGIDYPIYHTVPDTHFSCHNVPAHPGMYANVETGCQAYHVCHDGREGHQGASFLCTNGTLFNQKEFACDWWYNVDCHEATNYYRLNLDPEKNPYFPKKKVEEEHQQVEAPAHYETPVHYEAPVQYQYPIRREYQKQAPEQYHVQVAYQPQHGQSHY